MPNLLEGKTALILGIASKWSLAYAIAQAFWREGATLALTYLGDRQKIAIEEMSAACPWRGCGPAMSRRKTSCSLSPSRCPEVVQ
jgi:enoyl-[acyl-carrier-protein] reductase (NADH)